jgi:organic radical activating enzyme
MKLKDGSIINSSDIVSSGNPDYELITYSWNLIDICQYKCTYCSAMNFNLHTFRNKPELENVWKSVCAKIKLSNTPYAVEILGGEPTLHPHIDSIINKLGKQKNCVQVDLITNLAKPTKFYQKFDTVENKKLTIEASYHPEYSNKKNYTDKVIELNRSEFINVFPNIVLPDDSKYWSQTKNLIDTFRDANVGVNLNFLQNVDDGVNGKWEVNYTDEFWVYFNEYFDTSVNQINIEVGTGIHNAEKHLKNNAGSGEMTKNIKYTDKYGKDYYLSERDINKNKLQGNKGWNCKALMYTINMDGTIINSCTNELIPLTQINKKGLTKCVTCPLPQCSCDIMFLFPKTNPKYVKND